MDLNAAIDIVIKDLNEAKDIIEDLKKYPGVPAFQVELAKSKCRSAAEVITLLKDLSERINSEREITQVKRQEKPPEIILEPPLSNPVPTPQEIRTEIKMTVLQEPKPLQNPDLRQTPKKHAENAILADQFSGRDESYNEKMGSMKHEDDIVEMMKSKPLTSLSEAIGINDRFLFIREIFKGDQDTYNATMIKLDSAHSLADAKALISSFTTDDSDVDAVKQFMDLLKRKFHGDE